MKRWAIVAELGARGKKNTVRFRRGGHFDGLGACRPRPSPLTPPTKPPSDKFGGVASSDWSLSHSSCSTSHSSHTASPPLVRGMLASRDRPRRWQSASFLYRFNTSISSHFVSRLVCIFREFSPTFPSTSDELVFVALCRVWSEIAFIMMQIDLQDFKRGKMQDIPKNLSRPHGFEHIWTGALPPWR